MNFESLAYAQQATGAAAQQGQGSFMVLLPMYLIIFAIFYFFLIRPQQKQQQEKLGMIAQLKKNDEYLLMILKNGYMQCLNHFLILANFMMKWLLPEVFMGLL